LNQPVRAIWTTESTEVIKTGSWRVALPAYVNPPAPCHNACPVDGNIAVWIQFVEKKAYQDAWLTLIENNPLPAVTGRICHRPCEDSCNRAQLDEPIAIRCLERFVGDMALDKGWAIPDIDISKKETIAIVGGGPAGLAAAFHLRRMGYAVTLFEAQPQFGGVLRYGIPSYRLPKDILDAEIQRILALGIDVRTNTRISSQADFEKLRSEFAAVFIATGATVPKRLPQLDYSQPWVIESANYLEQTNVGEQPQSGERVVVIGGGSAAMDVARTARRHGKEVTVLCLEAEPEMPAQRDEVLEAKDEGITLIDGVMLQSVKDRAPGNLQLACIRVNFEAGAERGEFEVTPIPGTEFNVDADTIVPAIGQDPDTTSLQELLHVEVGLVQVDEQCETSLGGVFAGGDLVTMERFVTVAFGFGKQAAIEIDRNLRSETKGRELPSLPNVPIDVINTHYHPQASRAKQRLVSAAERQTSFDEVELALPGGEVLAESQRCFSCGNCTFCDNCFYYCPDMAINRQNGGYSVNDDYCKGCGLCVRECPTGAIVMRQEI
jgi:NADPH-dependent glutamate synthase beta subunit-like oxidoreductase/Pyruvate/2-oxoacid:ferredoxin oxidoreductase delta subunit